MTGKNKDPGNIKTQLDALQDVDDRHVDTPMAARLDLLAASEAVDLSSVAQNSVVTVTAEGEDYVFHKPADTHVRRDGREEWTLITEGEDGSSVESPVVMMGTAAAASGAFVELRPPAFRKGQHFVVGKLHRFKSGSDEGVPEEFNYFPPTEAMAPEVLEANLAMGAVTRDADGQVYWQPVTEMVLSPVRQVSQMSLEGVESRLK